jgi:uncharacterized membrane protein
MIRERVRPIDAARGTAMLFVFLSHFAEVYLRNNGVLALLYPVYKITMIASPTFMVISGIMLGYLYRTETWNFGPIRERFVNRGLFLLTIGRLLIFVAHISIAGGIQEALHWGFITDAIGVSIIVGPLLIDKVQWKGRLLIAVLVFVMNWVVILLWSPELWALKVLKETLFGPAGTFNTQVYADVFPLVPWFSLYFLGTCIGERIGEHSASGEKWKIAPFVLKAWAGSWLIVLALLGGRYLISSFGITGFENEIRSLTSPFQKLSPSPAFFSFYGGAGLFILYLLFRFEGNALVNRVASFAEVLGQTSLFVFIIQYYVYFTFFSEVNFGLTMVWPLYFVASVAVISIVSKVWYERGLNRLLVVPYLASWMRKQTAFGDEGAGM